MIGLIDYGAGNLNSVKKAFEFLGYKCEILLSSDGIMDMERIVLPGVGAFGAASGMLIRNGFFEPLKKWISGGKPFLGICLGMQLMMRGSDEDPDDRGLSAVKGTSKKFTSLRIPQIGWNNVMFPEGESLFEGIKSGTRFYFNHSFYVEPDDVKTVAAETEYGIRYASAVRVKRAYGVQFHPEKSSDAGLKLLDNWVKLC